MKDYEYRKENVEGSKKEITCLVYGILVKIYIIDTSDIICVKSSHKDYLLLLYLVWTEPFEIA